MSLSRIPYGFFKAFALAVAFLFIFPLPASASVTFGSINLNPLSSGLVAYWPLDGNSTNWTTDTTADIVGGNTGTLNSFSTTTSPTAGRLGQALKFDGSASYISTAYTIPAQSSATSFTWSAWVYLNNNTNGNLVILGFRNGATWAKLTPTAFEYSAGSIMSYSIPLKQWVYVVIVKNGSNFTYYANGAVVSTASNSSAAVSHTFFIGEDPGFPGDGVLSGKVDEVRVYGRALSAQEASILYAMGQVKGGHSLPNSTTSSFNIGLSVGLSAYWSFDGNTLDWRTNSAADLSGNGYSASLASMSTTSSPTAGRIGQALVFNGSTNSLSFTATSLAGTPSDLTYCAWLSGGLSGTKVAVSLGDSGTNVIWLGAAGGKWEFVTANNVFLDSAQSITAGWHYVCATYTGGVSTLYVDGAFSSSGSKAIATVTANGTIGKYSGGGFFWPGSIDDVRIYSRALSAQEINTLYHVGAATAGHSNPGSGTAAASGLVGYWTFDGPNINWTANTAADSSGNGNTGTLVLMSTTSSPTATTGPVPGKVGQALTFDGTDAYMQAQDSTSLNIAGSLTLSAWIKPAIVNTDQKIVGKQDNNNGYKMTLFSGNKIELQLMNGGVESNLRAAAGGTQLSAGKWYFVVCTYSTDSGIIACYLNGQLDRSGSFGATALGASTGVVLQIGASFVDGGGNRFHGIIDDVRVYNRALSAREILQLYQNSH